VSEPDRCRRLGTHGPFRRGLHRALRISGSPAALAALTVLYCAGGTAPLHAQTDSVAVEPGERVRMQAPAVAAERFTGRIEAVFPDSLVVRPDGFSVPLGVPWDAVQSLELYRPERRNAGAQVGALVGAAAGTLLALAFIVDESCVGCGSLVTRFGLATPYALIGAAIGGALGSLIGGDVWLSVPLPRRSP
jgi:hypothetical protein